MPNYEPKGFFSSKSFTGLSTEDHVNRSVKFLENPEITLLLDHIKHEIAAADKVGDERHGWELLQYYLSEIENDFINDNAERANWHFFQIGCTFSALETNLEEHLPLMQEGVKAIQLNFERNAGLLKKNLRRDAIRKKAQELAKITWDSDETHSIRLSDMCELVWSSLFEYKDFNDVLPDIGLGLKPWLRPVAPDWAKKPGRPKAK